MSALMAEVLVTLFDDGDDQRLRPLQVRLPQELWDKLAAIAKAESARLTTARGRKVFVSRNDVIMKMLELESQKYDLPATSADKDKKLKR